MRPMPAKVEELPENKVRLTVDVTSHELEHAVEHAGSDLAATARDPRFPQGQGADAGARLQRIGKEQRLPRGGREPHRGVVPERARRDEDSPDHPARVRLHASREPGAGLQLHGDGRRPAEGRGRRLDEARGRRRRCRRATGAGRPADRGLQVRRSPSSCPWRAAPPRRGTRSSSTSSGATAARSATTRSSSGSGRVVEELEQALVGMSAGETKEVEYELADGQTTKIEVTLKELKEKVLPPLDDELARAASEFDTLAELRADVEERIREQIEEEVETRFRAAAADELVIASKVQPSLPLVQSRTAELLTGLVRSLERRGISPETYLAVSNQTPQQLEERMRAEAAALRRARARARGRRRQGRHRGDRRRGQGVHPRARRGRGRRGRPGRRPGLRQRPARASARRPAHAQGARQGRRPRSSGFRSSSPRREKSSGRPRRRRAPRRQNCGPPEARSQPYEPVDPDGDRADLAWRARVRHLLPPPQREDHLPRHACR